MSKQLMTYEEWKSEAIQCCKLTFDLPEDYMDFSCEIIVDYWRDGFTAYEALLEELEYEH